MVVAAVAGRSVVKLRLWSICVFDIIYSSSFFFLFCFSSHFSPFSPLDWFAEPSF